MKHLLFITLVGSFLLQSCAGTKNNIPTGTYYGELPCADCPGINYELELNNDKTYTERMLYLERDTAAREESGNFRITNDTLLILKDKSTNSGMNKFVITEDSLRMLDKSGNAITSGFSDKYILTTTKSEKFSMMAEQKDNSIGFKATGNEPFWSLEIDFNNKMHFKTLADEEMELISPVPDPVKPQDVDAVSYRAKTESGTLHVTIFRKDCQDTMSGEKSDHFVRVSASTGENGEMMDFEGCGTYLGDYRLNDIWALETINSEKFESSKVPNLDFNLKEQRVSGFGGCNRITGPITINEENIEIGNLVATKMACPNMEMENQFLKAITGKSFNFEIGNNQLILSSEETELVFKKVD
ncbi:copper resistance protein NlpE N-terminal domain-containing protein [Christiangramia forsetii]|nr:copper resistance protein NlpE N-terminal domain-containing protein [Christiangramia forsetii]